MHYKEDKDLSFLEKVESKRLWHLRDILLYDKVGKNRKTAFDESYDLTHQDENGRKVKDWQIYAGEIQCFGGNTAANIIRFREGICYNAIVDDIANKMDLTDYLSEKTKSLDEKEKIIKKEKVLIEEIKKYVVKQRVKAIFEKCIEEIENILKNKKWADGQRSEKICEILQDTIKSVVKKRKIEERVDVEEINKIIGNKDLKVQQKNEKLEEMVNNKVAIISNKVIESLTIQELQQILREHYDSSSEMETLLQDAAAERKKWIYKVGNFLADNIYIPCKVLNQNWSIMVQSMIEISLLREVEGLSIAIVGSTGSGKTTLLNYLKTGKFGNETLGTVGEQPFSRFNSPLLNLVVEGGYDISGANHYFDRQKALCQNKDLVFYCFNPREIMENETKKDDFYSRLGALKDLNETKEKKIIFIATHCDEYNKDEMKNKIHEITQSDEMGNAFEKFNIDNCFYINLKDECQVIEMFKFIQANYL